MTLGSSSVDPPRVSEFKVLVRIEATPRGRSRRVDRLPIGEKGLRIVGGKFKGRRLKVQATRRVRPTSDRVREAMFDVLGQEVWGCRFLDLYAGSGACGLEALSRGADHVTFVDQHFKSWTVIGENIDLCGARQRTRLLRMPVAKALAKLSRNGDRFHVVFVDPPYFLEKIESVFQGVAQITNPGAVLVLEHSSRRDFHVPVGTWSKERVKTYGDTTLSFYRRCTDLVEDSTDATSGAGL